ncbi:3'(2'),5'-bisphosphate nucleotidase CysQ [Rhodococcus sp. D2-41]|uniref:3'(2'),5'-bisphosphate nucleotidase CysQ n=1 Tax=Speluncibacter jeojiensis TaxID=2710754 RepID=A0A9X4M387_9ACTN|nr:3'(2'),5'-bisphosphate nucleotidase CysQ [Rhodococcus sp. D2-41]MDG3017064.1 3'(2'),5'-bisphosphate nucleotidase CysQ [Corynebacteriales bacterium D3-21]
MSRTRSGKAADDPRLAAELATAAGALLLRLREESIGEVTAKELGRRGDTESNELLLRELAAARPGDAVLSEESADSAARLSADRVWIVDPLDGTREFGLAGRTDWAVHVALWEAGRSITAAAVAQPALGVTYASDTVGRASGDPGAASDERFRIVVSDSRPPEFVGRVVEELGTGEIDAVLVPMGSAGAKTMAVVRGEADAYLHAGGQWEWDSAAPVGVAVAAGLHASRIDGSPLNYNAPHPYLPDLLICPPDRAAALLAAIERAQGVQAQRDQSRS